MPEAVIVSVARSPIGRAVKGSLAVPSVVRRFLAGKCWGAKDVGHVDIRAHGC